jgi:hypothetical protein
MLEAMTPLVIIKELMLMLEGLMLMLEGLMLTQL